jgi:hypothetical protein
MQEKERCKIRTVDWGESASGGHQPFFRALSSSPLRICVQKENATHLRSASLFFSLPLRQNVIE